jgi:hypothetical protein
MTTKTFLRSEVMKAAIRVMTFGVGRRRSWKREALWLAGTAGVGTLVGALAAGKKGAAIGAMSSGAARFIAALATK